MKTQKNTNPVPSDLERRENDEIQEQRLLGFLRNREPVWKDEDRPEIEDSAEWVGKLRWGEI